MTEWFTADLHFGHARILEYCRPMFASVEEMNTIITNNWNKRVSDSDTVYVVGDFAMGKKDLWPEYRKNLNGKIVLIRGNHDVPEAKIQAAMYSTDVICDEFVIYSPNGQGVHMAHYPGMDVYDDGRGYVRATTLMQPGFITLCGHVHEKFVEHHGFINVGIDVRGFMPVTLEELGIK